jgi:hypothetical protein
MAAPALQDFAFAFHEPHFHITVPALPPGATGVWWMCGTVPDSPLVDFAPGSGDIETSSSPEVDEIWYCRIAWGTADGPLSDPSPAHEAQA